MVVLVSVQKVGLLVNLPTLEVIFLARNRISTASERNLRLISSCQAQAVPQL